MPPLPIIDSKKLVKILLILGFEKTRTKGSHQRFVHPDGRKTIVPFHGKKIVPRGLLNKIIKEDLNLTIDKFIKYL